MTQELTTTNQQLATAGPSPFAMTTFEGVEKMAAYIADAQLYGIKKPSQAITLMMMAHEERMTIVQLMRRVHVFEDGKISQRADFTQAEFERVGRIVYHIRTDEVVCATFFLKKDITDEDRARGAERFELLRTLEDLKWTDPRDLSKERKVENQLSKIARENEETVLRTLADADSRGISQGSKGTKTNWATSPRSMLQWRCVTEGVKVVAPFVLAGMPSDVELQDAKVIEQREASRITTATEVKQEDVPAILEIIAQHDAELATDLSDARRKTVQGLRMDLVCKLADIGVKPPAEPEAPAPTVGGQPVKAVETTVLPPDQSATKQPAARQQRAQRPAATPATPSSETPPTNDQNASTPWRDFICLRGNDPGPFLRKSLGHIFLEGHFAPHTLAKLDKLVETFMRQGFPTSSEPHDKILWAKIKEADAELSAKFAPGSTAAPASPETPAPTPEVPQAPAGAKRWQDFVVPGKNPDFAGKKLGDLGRDGIERLHREYLPQIDWTAATLPQKTLKAMVQMALDDGALQPELLPPAANPGAHVAHLLQTLKEMGWDPGIFLNVCKLNFWVEESHRRAEEITAEEMNSLSDGWDDVKKEMAKAIQPAQQR